MRLHLTRRICAEIRPRLRELADVDGGADYGSLIKIAMALDDSAETSRGEIRVDLTMWRPDDVVVLRDILAAARAACPQVQIRAALQRRMDHLDEHMGTSAVERLGRLS